MRTVTNEVLSNDADLVLIGNGDPEQAREFLSVTEYPQDVARLRLLLDPDLNGYRAANLRRRLLAPYSPIGWLRGAALALRGGSLGRVGGDNFQLGGVLIITPQQQVEYSYLSETVYDKAPLSKVLETLNRLKSSESA